MQIRVTFIPIFNVSAKTGEGISQLRSFLNGKTVAFAGQSAVGKSSLLNAIIPKSLII